MKYQVGDCRERKVTNATVRECWDGTKFVVQETIPDCREIERPHTKITECYINNKWTVTNTEYECIVRKDYQTFYRECWTGTAWGPREPLRCEPDPATGRTRCWDPDEGGWEWENRYEVDNSMDGSLLTSIETDGLAGTSASEDPFIQGVDETYRVDDDRTSHCGSEDNTGDVSEEYLDLEFPDFEDEIA